MGRRKLFYFTCPTNAGADADDKTTPFPSGKALLVRLAAFAVSRGISSHEVRPHGFIGWHVYVRIHGRCFDLHLQRGDAYVLFIDQAGMLNFLRAKASFGNCVRELSEIICDWIATECGGELVKIDEDWCPPSM